jgi:pimeloyl-ACP methyl ester carboxylesterase
MIHYIDSNNIGNINLLLLHGLGTDVNSWQFQFEDLPKHGYRLIAPDLPGFGESKFSGKKWGLQYAVDQVMELMDRHAIQKFVPAGISFGGVVAMKIALQFPNRIQGLILINTFSNLKPKSISEWSYFFRRGLRAFLMKPADQAKIVAERVFPLESQSIYRDILEVTIRKSNPRVYRRVMYELARINLKPELSNIKTKTLVISGADDTTIPLKNQKELALLIPGAEHKIIPKAGHAVIVDQPVHFNQCVVEFLDKISSNEIFK